jgi:hypothetical protein
MFRALLSHPQEALHKRHLVYCNPGTLYARYIPIAVWAGPPEDEQVMLEPCTGR